MSVAEAYEQLLDLLLDIPQFQQTETRNILFDSLPHQLANLAARSSSPITDLQNLIILLKRVGKLDTGEWPVVPVLRVVKRYLPPNQEMHHRLDAILSVFEPSAVPRSGATPATQPEPSVFISYAWGDEREALVDKIDNALQARGLRIIRDKRDLGYKGSIQQFMERIGRGDCVIVVISDKYLRSPNCMFELVEIAENKDFQNRIFPVMWKDANIYDPLRRIDYIQHWEAARTKLARAIQKLDPANLQGLREEMDLYDRIRDRISGLTSILKNMNARRIEFQPAL